MENGSGANYVGNLKGEEKIIGSANVGAMYHPGLSVAAQSICFGSLQIFTEKLTRNDSNLIGECTGSPCLT